MLDVELQLFADNLRSWLQTNPEQYVLVHHRDVVGFYSTVDEALAEGARRFGLQSFLVRKVQAAEPAVFIPALALNLIHAGP